jgi:hypothetical protein
MADQTVNARGARTPAFNVGQDDILRADWQSDLAIKSALAPARRSLLMPETFHAGVRAPQKRSNPG